MLVLISFRGGTGWEQGYNNLAPIYFFPASLCQDKAANLNNSLALNKNRVCRT